MALSLWVGGCASQKLPTYPWVDTDTAVAQLASQDARLQSILAAGSVTLTDSKNRTDRLAASLVVKFPDYMRLRAWKSGQAAFDLMFKPEGVWLMVPEQRKADESFRPVSAVAADLSRAWPTFHGDFFTALNIEIEDHFGKTFWIQRRLDNGAIIRCEVDRATLTVVQNQVLDRHGRQRYSVAYEHYAVVNDLAVPHRIVAKGEQGTVVIDLLEMQVNRPTPAGAFVPPEHADRLP